MRDVEYQFTDLLIPGIIEIVGDNGVGKTNFILHMLKNKKVIYITTNLFLVMYKLKTLSLSHDIKVVISNILYENKYYTEEKIIYNKYLGYRWCYIPNARYIIRKKGSISTLYSNENKEILHFIVQCFGTIQIC